jgi:hypothetical protein
MFSLIIVKYSFFNNTFTKIIDIHNTDSKAIEEIGIIHGFNEENSLNYPNDIEDLVVNTVADKNNITIFVIKYRK